MSEIRRFVRRVKEKVNFLPSKIEPRESRRLRPYSIPDPSLALVAHVLFTQSLVEQKTLRELGASSLPEWKIVVTVCTSYALPGLQ